MHYQSIATSNSSYVKCWAKLMTIIVGNSKYQNEIRYESETEVFLWDRWIKSVCKRKL